MTTLSTSDVLDRHLNSFAEYNLAGILRLCLCSNLGRPAVAFPQALAAFALTEEPCDHDEARQSNLGQY
jgi:hypothetical protein